MNETAWLSNRKTLISSFLFAISFHAALFALVRHLPFSGRLKVTPPQRLVVHLRPAPLAKGISLDLHKMQPACFFPVVPPIKRVLPKGRKRVRPVRRASLPKKLNKGVVKKTRSMTPSSRQSALKKAWLDQIVRSTVSSTYAPPVAASSAKKPKAATHFGSSFHGRKMAYPDYSKSPALTYPPLARWRGIEGKVILKVLVSQTGQPLNVLLEKSSGSPILDRAAVKAVKEWVFRPGKIDGTPVDMWVRVPVLYRLK